MMPASFDCGRTALADILLTQWEMPSEAEAFLKTVKEGYFLLQAW